MKWENPDELEDVLKGLAQKLREEETPKDILPLTLRALASRPRKTPLLVRLEPILSTLMLFLLFIIFFSFSSDRLLNIIRLTLLLFSISLFSLFLFYPEKMAQIDRKILGVRLARIGPIATPFQEILLFRLQGLYFLFIALFICKL